MRTIVRSESWPRVKVTVISHAYQDERYLTTWDAMARCPDVEISLIHPGRYKGVRSHWHGLHPIADFPVPVMLGAWQGGFCYHPRALHKALDQARPDLILHEQEVYALSAAQIATVARRRSIPLVQFVWENIDRKLALPRRLLRGYVLAHASGLIAGSEHAKSIHEQWGFRGHIAVMPQMGVDAARAPHFERLDNNVLRICFVGRLVPCKGVDCLLRAVEMLHRRGFTVACAIAGEGPEHARLARLARDLGIWALVHFLGHLCGGDVRRLLQSSDVLVLPSRRTDSWEEQFGLVLAEAMAEATVTVGSKTGAIPEVLGSEQLLFAEDDAAGLAEILRNLAIDPEFYLRCRMHGWQRARQRFSTEVVADQRLRFLHAVLDSQRASVNQPIDHAMPVATR